MIDLSNLFRVLPISHLEPETVAFVDGLTEQLPDGRWQPADLELLEPPAGQGVPYVEPIRAMTALFRHQGQSPETAEAQAVAEYAALRPSLRLVERVRFFDSCNADTPECVPLPRLSEHLRARQLIADHLADFLARVLDRASLAPIFGNPDQPHAPWSLKTLPDQPPAKAMIEFIPGVPCWYCDLDEEEGHAALAAWHTALRPIVERLESVLGQEVYSFCDLDDEYGDDYGHRFLVLYCCCLYQPQSTYVQFLLEASGAKDVEVLKAALIDPANYRHPFEMNYRSCDDFETRPCRFHYQPPNSHRVVGIVFSSSAARAIAETRLLELIDVEVFIVAPKALASDEWIKKATRHCSDWVHHYLRDDLIAKPITLLARLDELVVISNDSYPRSRADLGVSPSIEELMWYAHILKVPTQFLHSDGTGLWNPEDILKTCKVPERVAEHERRREDFTQQIKAIRLDCEYASSGLWNEKGQMIGYDQLSIPFELVRRIAAWHGDFEKTIDPPATGDEAWWDQHAREEMEIAQALQRALRSDQRVLIDQDSQWKAISDIVRTG